MNKKVLKLASGGKRLGAYAIDKVIPFFLWIVIIAAAVDMYSYNSYSFGYGYGYGNMGVGGHIATIVICSILLFAYTVVQIVFYVKSQTIGKAILGLQVIDAEKGEPVGIWKMLLREWFAKKASEVVFCIGFLWILIDEKNRGWHDKIMDTYVVDLKESQRLSAKKSVEPVEEVQEDAVVVEPVEEVQEETVVAEPVEEVEIIE